MSGQFLDDKPVVPVPFSENQRYVVCTSRTLLTYYVEFYMYMHFTALCTLRREIPDSPPASRNSVRTGSQVGAREMD